MPRHLPVIVIVSFLLSGCISQRGISTLQEVPGAADRLAGLQFRVAAVEGESKHAGAGASSQGLQGLMARDYPQFFSEEPDALPLLVRFKSEQDDQIAGAVLTGLTLGIIPFPVRTGFNMEVGVTPWSGTGGVLPESVIRYSRRDHGWMTIFTPLGLIPIPGRSDMERDTSTVLTDPTLAEYVKKQGALSDRVLQKAILSALAGLDQPALRRYAADRKATPTFSTDIDGRRYESRLVPFYSRDMRQPGGADQYRLHMKTVDASGKATTYLPVVARRDDGGAWQVLRPYLLFASRPTVATVLLENGVPARGIVMPVEQPPLADFIERPEVDGQEAAWIVRWSNGILLQIKNSTLAGELRGQSLPQLQELMTRLESSLLDLNERVGRANDRAQQAIEKGENPEALRELAVVYRQRGEVLKAILGAVRQEAATRGTP
ncbi:MAG: hypothetical protein WBJ03_02645 [Moraxellaceae bacterium]